MTEPVHLSDDLTVLAIPAFADNYLWLLHDREGNAVAVDPGDNDLVQAQLDRARLTLRAILLTHHHPDHIGGAAQLANRHGCPVYGPADARIAMITQVVKEGDSIQLDCPRLDLKVMHLPGHTLSHVAYIGHAAAFVGDTLFSAGCGRLFEGSAEQMLQSLGRLAQLPTGTLVFCGHEYTRDNARFALEWEPENLLLRDRYRIACERFECGQSTLPTTIGDELTFNPFLRCDRPGIRSLLQMQSHDPIGDRLAAFTCLRTLKNTYVAHH